MAIETLTWIGIAFCISQSAVFSGLNLAFFSLSRLRLEVEAAAGNKRAQRVLELRRDPNLVLTTVLVGNVAINVLLTLLSDSVLAGVGAFFFSTVVITAFGEILPQSYFSRNAIKTVSLLEPLLRFYRAGLYPLTKPVALLLDRWLGPEGLIFLRELEMRHLIRKHIEASEAEIDRIEGLGALNFLEIDDVPIVQEGKPIDPRSILTVPFRDGRPSFPAFEASPRDPFLRAVQASGRKWVVLLDEAGAPRLVMDADGFLRDVLFSDRPVDPTPHCHRPIVVTDATAKLGGILAQWHVGPGHAGDRVIDRDIVIFWGTVRHVITGADILGRLLTGIAKEGSAAAA